MDTLVKRRDGEQRKMKRWMEGDSDKKMLMLMNRYGALTGTALAVIAGCEYQYTKNRLRYLRTKMGYIARKPHMAKDGQKKRKVGTLYYLTASGQRYLEESGLAAEAQADCCLRANEEEKSYRASEVLKSIYGETEAEVKTQREICRELGLPHTLQFRYVINGDTAVFLPGSDDRETHYGASWIKTAMFKLNMLGITKAVIVAADREHHRRLLRSYYNKLRLDCGTAYVLLPGEVGQMLVRKGSTRREELRRLEIVLGPVTVRPNLIEQPALTVQAASKKFYAVDAVDYDLNQIYTIRYFQPERAVKGGYTPNLTVFVRDHDAAADVLRLYPHLERSLRFVGISLPWRESFFAISGDRVITAEMPGKEERENKRMAEEAP